MSWAMAALCFRGKPDDSGANSAICKEWLEV
jgi:hypothetical protein